MFPRLSRLIALGSVALTSCASNPRALYSFIAHEGYRAASGSGTASIAVDREELLVRCSEESEPRTCIYEDQDLTVDVELANRAPVLSIRNESDSPMTISWEGARFVLHDGVEAPAELVTDIKPPSSSDLEPNATVEVRLHPLDGWEESCEDVDTYHGPTRSGHGNVFGGTTPADQKMGAPKVTGCREYPKAFIPEEVKLRDRSKSVTQAEKKALLRGHVGDAIRLVLPVTIDGRRFDYVVGYKVESAIIR